MLSSEIMWCYVQQKSKGNSYYACCIIQVQIIND